MQGFRLSEVPVNHRPRMRGKTKYTINNRLWVGLDDMNSAFFGSEKDFFTTKS
jgi:hypothetical protein